MSSFLDPDPKQVKDLLKPAILKRFKEGRGSGTGNHYKPFLTVRDIPSKGRVHRRPSIKSKRIVHLLSDLELAAFLLFDWSRQTVDIREQFPLAPDKTIEIAKRIGVKHPAYQGVYQVMTTDLLIDLERNGKNSVQAICIKYKEDLENPRVIEKLEIERRYWESQSVPWYIFTENEVPIKLLKNIRWLIPHFYSFELDKRQQLEVFQIIHRAISDYPSDKIAVVMRQLDESLNTESGTHLSYLRHLLAQRAFNWDITNILHTSLKTNQLETAQSWINEEALYVYAE